MKICVIGDSHCGSLFNAWKENSYDTDTTLTFFALPRKVITKLEVSNGKLILPDKKYIENLRLSSFGHKNIVPEEYDCFLIYGMFQQPPPHIGDKAHSSDLRHQILADRAKYSEGYDAIRKLREISHLPIDFAPSPYMAPHPRIASAEWEMSVPEENKIFEDVFSELDARYIAQPHSTILDDKMRATKSIFNVKAERIKIRDQGPVRIHPDRIHMNAHYADIWLRQYLGMIGSE